MPTPEPASLRRIADHLNDMVAVFDASGRCMFLNRAGRRLLRLPADGEPPNLTLRDLGTADDQELLDAVLDHVGEGEEWNGTISLATGITGETSTRSSIFPLDPGDLGRGIAWVAKDTTTDREVIRTLRQRAFYDQITGLSHRTLFLDRLDLLLRRVTEEPGGVGVLFITPDRFKERLNRFPHGSDAVVLKAIAQRIPQALAGDQTVHRWGDEDFVVLCERVADEREAEAVAEHVIRTFDEPFVIDGEHVFLTASSGVAVGAPGQTGTDELIRQADAAGQLARNVGNAVRLFDEELRARALRRAEIEDGLRNAIARNELVLHYQPEVLLRTNQIVACEALLRWQHREWGLVSPAEFIPVAESSNLIIDIGEWVLREALHQSTEWAARFPDRPPVTVAVNISSRQFRDEQFEDRLIEVLADTGASPRNVCLEITESVLLEGAEEIIARLNRLKVIGVHLAVDDFGTGYSSLSYLRRFPVDILKVDQSFVSGLGHDPEDSAIVQAVVHMGQALQMTTLAEGVETAHHVIELRELDCDIGQGFHFARPVPAEQFEAFLEAGDDWLRDSTG